MKLLRILSLVALVIASVACVDLLCNLLGTMIPELNVDGITSHCPILWAQVYVGDGVWSLARFYEAFVTSAKIWLALLVENAVLAIAALRKR